MTAVYPDYLNALLARDQAKCRRTVRALTPESMCFE